MRKLLAILLFAVASRPAEAAPAQGELVRTVRVLVQNIYGRNENDCEERYKSLAAHVLDASPAFDVVAFNEHWKVPVVHSAACDPDVLTRGMEADGRYKGKTHSIQHVPRTDDFPQVAGGDSIFTLHTLADTYENHFVNGRSIPLSGYVLARVELAPGVQLDVWDVHLEALGGDGCDDFCRLEQVTDFAGAVELLSGVPDAGKRGNPVLVVGDFNIGGPLTKSEKPPFSGNAGYADIMDVFHSPRDMWLEVGSGGGGYTYDCKENHSQSCTERERIDYAFVPEHRRILDPRSEYVLVPKSVSIVRWKTPAGVEISDHYGLDATLEIRKRAAGQAASQVTAPEAYPTFPKSSLDWLSERPIRFDGR